MNAKFLAGLTLAVLLGLAAAAPAADEQKLGVWIVKSGEHTIFAVAIKEAGLVELFRGEESLTVFAPTDAAFDKLGDDKIRAVVKDKDLLKKIVLAHVVKGRLLYAKDLAALDGKDLNGFKVAAGKDGVRIGGAKVTRPDVDCSNGVIHVTDAVLIPAG
ncbi:MAG: hypothetical protein JWO38_2697 [Gemmataceae bacterium]|nr:hypothetical protein [Gemmataceae bacterium]